LRQAKQFGGKLPERIVNAPSLFTGLELYFSAFLDLTSCRALGYSSEGPISWLSINEWALVHELDAEQRENLLYFIPRMDAAFLEHRAKKLNAELKKKG